MYSEIKNKLLECSSTYKNLSSCLISISKTTNAELVSLRNEIISITSFLPLKATLPERVHCILNNITNISQITCKNNKILKFHGTKLGYGFCGTGNNCLCKKQVQSEIISKKMKNTSKEQFAERLKKAKETNNKKYGVDNPMQDATVRNKMKDTIINKYGVDNISKREECKEKKKQTTLQNHGVEYPMQSKVIKEKSQTTCLLRYNVTCPLKNADIRKKREETNLKRYNCINPASNIEIIEKIKSTNVKRYGVSCSFLRPDIKERIAKTMLDKYGVQYALQNSDILRKMKTTIFNRYKVFNIVSIPGVKEKIHKTMLKKYGVDNPMQNKNIRENACKTNVKKYGVTNPSQYYKIKEKQKHTMLQKYGCVSPLQNTDILEKMRGKNLQKTGYSWTQQNPDTRQKTYKTCIEKYGTKYVSQRNIDTNVLNILNDKDQFTKLYSVHSNRSLAALLNVSDVSIINYAKLHGIHVSGRSSYELQLRNFLISCGFKPEEDFVENKFMLLNGKQLDFYIPSKKIAIEFNGLHFHSSANKNITSLYHYQKMIKAKEMGIRLVTIFEDELLEKQDVVFEYLRNILQISDKQRIFARRCTVKLISATLANDFLQKYHLQGKPASSGVYVALYHLDSIVAVMSFHKQRNKHNNEGLWELSRFSCGNVKVVGAAGKLLSFFIKTYYPDKIISFADARWSTGDMYFKLGFELETFIRPDYRYYKPGTLKRTHKSKYTKNKIQKMGIDIAGKTESQLTTELGLHKIWDCGKYRFVWVK